MMVDDSATAILPLVDDEMRALVRVAAAVAAAGEAAVRSALAAAIPVRHPWVEEVLLQSYLFAGFPRTLNAMREWRRVSGRPAPVADPAADETQAATWRAAGERTCATVYGAFYAPLRTNVRELHPALDSWMIVDGYGKVLSRPGLDLARRELCIVAACAAAGQDRQLHAHLHGALHAGAAVQDLHDTLEALDDFVVPDDRARFHHLLLRVAAHHVR